MNEGTQKAGGTRFKKVLYYALIFIFSIIVTLFVETYTYVNDILFPWWPVALALGALAGVAFAIKAMDGEGIGRRILSCVIITFIVFSFTGIALGHINHFFDSSEDVRYYAEIEDKDYTNKFFGSDKYKFTFTVNGDTFEIDVSSYDYNSHDVGDSYVIEYHEGALGEPYYIAVGPVP